MDDVEILKDENEWLKEELEKSKADVKRIKTWNKWFYEMVKQMRELQKGYNRNQGMDPARLRAEVESAVDREIQRIENKLMEHKNKEDGKGS